jgi:hypothetical protein
MYLRHFFLRYDLRLWFAHGGHHAGFRGLEHRQHPGRGVPDFANQGVRMTKDIWMSMPAGLSLGSQGALSILTNFAHVGDCAGGPPA